jgi:hypothetical protein
MVYTCRGAPVLCCAVQCTRHASAMACSSCEGAPQSTEEHRVRWRERGVSSCLCLACQSGRGREGGIIADRGVWREIGVWRECGMDMSCPFVRHRQSPSSIAIVNRLVCSIPCMLYGLLRVVRNSITQSSPALSPPLSLLFLFSFSSLSLLFLFSSPLLSRKADDGRLSEEATLLYPTA